MQNINYIQKYTHKIIKKNEKQLKRITQKPYL